MSWAVPEYDRNTVNRAADVLLSNSTTDGDISHAMEVINNWRAIHACPLQTIKMALAGRAKKVEGSAIISQRTKRIPAIELKLRENRATGMEMKLTQMQDIGGCRAILRNVSQVEELVRAYEKATAKNPTRGCVFQRKYDYIETPKETGYRSVHLVYKYRSSSDILNIYNDLKIEIQIRSKLQHYWATAVETVDFFTGQALKSNIGELPWKRFFILVANEFARLEKRPLVPGAPENAAESKAELKGHLKQITALEGFKAATSIVTELGGAMIQGHFFLLQLDLDRRTVSPRAFRKDQAMEAQQEYLKAEEKNKDKPVQTVLVSVDSVAALPKAYPSFYLDISEFSKVLYKITE